jgi:hypothetical protein
VTGTDENVEDREGVPPTDESILRNADRECIASLTGFEEEINHQGFPRW